MTVGLDFTLKGVQDEFKKKGWPWLLSKGFPNSAVLGRFLDFPGVEELKKLDFALLKNGVQVPALLLERKNLGDCQIRLESR